MQGLKKAVDGAPITVLTHSAGGWLGRVYLLDWGTTGVDRFVSLGSPHQAPPKASDMTYMDEFPGACCFGCAARPICRMKRCCFSH